MSTPTDAQWFRYLEHDDDRNQCDECGSNHVDGCICEEEEDCE